MSGVRSKSVENIENKMKELSPETLRYQTLDCAKSFKSSWIELGQYLYVVYKDKHFREWGHSTFEVYCAKEIGIKHQTAVKLLKSYYFLEKDEPAFLQKHNADDDDDQASREVRPVGVPSFEAVNALRLAKESERMAPKDYEKIREEVLDKGGDPQEVKKKIKYFLKPAAEKQVTLEEKKHAAAKKWIHQLEGAMTELSNLSFPDKVMKKVEDLLDVLQGYK